MEIKFNKPNYEELEQWYNENTSEYERLLKAFMDNEDLPESDIFRLYYASIFTKEYAQYGHIAESIRSTALFEMSNQEWIEKAKEELKDCPFDIRTLSKLDTLERHEKENFLDASIFDSELEPETEKSEENGMQDNDWEDWDKETSDSEINSPSKEENPFLSDLFSDTENGEDDMGLDLDIPHQSDLDLFFEKMEKSRCSKLCKVILHSGNGTDDNPYYVIRVEDEYDFFYEMFFAHDASLLKQELIGHYIDKLTFETGPYKSHIVYFNMQPHMDRIHNHFCKSENDNLETES